MSKTVSLYIHKHEIFSACTRLHIVFVNLKYTLVKILNHILKKKHSNALNLMKNKLFTFLLEIQSSLMRKGHNLILNNHICVKEGLAMVNF